MTAAVGNYTQTQAGATQTIANGKNTLASNFQTFLSLLTAQLKNQDPLSPLDSNQFTGQLTQMSGVEQQLLTNDLLKSLVAQSGQGGMADGVSFIGKDVTAAASATRLEGKKATWSYELGTTASDATLEIVDGAGNTVWKGSAPDKSEGVHDFTWDGKDLSGRQLADGGVYTLKVTAKTASGADVDSQTLIRGVVSGVEMANGEAYLSVGSALVPLSNVISVQTRAQT
jgi:flagellar basal-body rod modification protein FlgD